VRTTTPSVPRAAGVPEDHASRGALIPTLGRSPRRTGLPCGGLLGRWFCSLMANFVFKVSFVGFLECLSWKGSQGLGRGGELALGWGSVPGLVLRLYNSSEGTLCFAKCSSRDDWEVEKD
jgi:hypothetical protein